MILGDDNESNDVSYVITLCLNCLNHLTGSSRRYDTGCGNHKLAEFYFEQNLGRFFRFKYLIIGKQTCTCMAYITTYCISSGIHRGKRSSIFE